MRNVLCALALFAPSDLVVLRPGGEVEGALTEAAPTATFTLVVEEASPVTVDVHGPRFDGTLTLRDAAGEVVAKDDNGWMHRHPRLVVEAAGTYTVEVGTTKGRPGPFTILLSRGTRLDTVDRRGGRRCDPLLRGVSRSARRGLPRHRVAGAGRSDRLRGHRSGA